LLSGNEDVVLTGLILQEVLQAFKAESTFRRVAHYFEPFAILEMERADYVAAARLHRKCAAKRISVSTADCQIAIASIHNDCPLLTADRDFQRINRCSSLKLV
jgi:predicted nucleic acid-binding protein